MSRHGYCDDLEQQQLAMWRGRVLSAIRGKRGQTMLRELRDALDSMPTKRLVSRVLQTKQGDCCTLGRLAQAKGIDLTEHDVAGDVDGDEGEAEALNECLAVDFNIAQCLVQEVEYENDEGPHKETPEQRWVRMRRWVDRHIKGATPELAAP